VPFIYDLCLVDLLGKSSSEAVDQVLSEITEACRDAPREDGKAKAIKMQSGWTRSPNTILKELFSN
jgi:hypothetical protein